MAPKVLVYVANVLGQKWTLVFEIIARKLQNFSTPNK